VATKHKAAWLLATTSIWMQQKPAGLKTAFVRRPAEWGTDAPPGPEPSAHHDIVVDTFNELAIELGVVAET